MSEDRRRRSGLVGALVVACLLLLYAWALAGRGVMLIRTGEPVGVVLGVAVLVLPLLVLWLVAREFRLAATVQTMADILADEGGLPVDDLPRSPGGRIDRDAADAAFADAQLAVEAAPESWRAWYVLAFAYDAARDRRRARESLRTAARLYRGAREDRGARAGAGERASGGAAPRDTSTPEGATTGETNAGGPDPAARGDGDPATEEKADDDVAGPAPHASDDSAADGRD